MTTPEQRLAELERVWFDDESFSDEEFNKQYDWIVKHFKKYKITEDSETCTDALTLLNEQEKTYEDLLRRKQVDINHLFIILFFTVGFAIIF